MDIYKEELVTEYEGTGRTGYKGFGFEKFRTGEKVEPKYQAAYNLNKTLEKYPGFTKEARSEIQEEFVDFPDLHVLNLEVLASVLDFLRLIPQPTPEDFRDEVIGVYFERLIPTKPITSAEKTLIYIRLKAQFLKYIVAILNFRTSEEE